MDEATKRCSKCREAKPLTQFYRRTLSRDGYNARCKDCCGRKPPRPPSRCRVPECPNKRYGHGLCNKHWQCERKHGDPLYRPPRRLNRSRFVCAADGCNRPRNVRAWCDMHYSLWRAHGDPLKRVNASPRQADHYHDGYHFIYANGRVVAEHRHVMEQILGRPLLPGETPHHKNGQRADNRPENLELWIRKQPQGQRAVDLLAWAEEIVARYGPERDLL